MQDPLFPDSEGNTAITMKIVVKGEGEEMLQDFPSKAKGAIFPNARLKQVVSQIVKYEI